MTDPDRQPDPHGDDADVPHSRGVNLILLYSLIALALIAAMSFALLIVKPFYHRH
jgi:hypothetical protein